MNEISENIEEKVQKEVEKVNKTIEEYNLEITKALELINQFKNKTKSE